MKKNYIMRSVTAFSAFSFLGPIIQRVSLPAFLSLHREDLTLFFWPALVFASGGRADNKHDFWMSVAANVVLFALLGLLAAAVVRNLKGAVAVYACVCGLITLVEAWGSGFSLYYFSWSVLILAFLAYWMPFWILIRGLPAPVSRQAGGRLNSSL